VSTSSALEYDTLQLFGSNLYGVPRRLSNSDLVGVFTRVVVFGPFFSYFSKMSAAPRILRRSHSSRFRPFAQPSVSLVYLNQQSPLLLCLASLSPSISLYRFPVHSTPLKSRSGVKEVFFFHIIL